VAPTIGALVSVACVRFVLTHAGGSGVNNTRAAVHVLDGYIPAGSVGGKFTVCSISIGTGNPLGPEDPALQMGAGVASLLGRLFHLPREQIRVIAPVGAAAGIAAAFNTPITAVLFVIELVIASWNASVLGSIVLAAVSSVVVTRWFLGDDPLFRVPDFALAHPSELLVYAAIGLAGGVLATVYVQLMLRLKRRVRRIEGGRPRLAVAAGAGALVGIVGLTLPEVMGPGYLTIDNALHGEYAWKALLILGLVKILVTAVAFAAEVPGGLFAPTLFAGAMVGGGIGAVAREYWPAPMSAPSAYMLVGMGTFFAGVFRAPMTSIFMVFEVSASYVIILPVMIANTLGYLVARQFHHAHLFDALALEEGFDLPSTEEQRERRALRVEDAMLSQSVLVLAADASVDAARRELGARSASWALVRLAPRTFATFRAAELTALGDGRADALLRDSLDLPAVPRLYPDLSLDAALARFGSRPALPVVRRNNPDQLVGALTIEDIHRAFGIGVPPAAIAVPPSPPDQPPNTGGPKSGVGDRVE
jgi:chloride channel protein, CIC family